MFEAIKTVIRNFKEIREINTKIETLHNFSGKNRKKVLAEAEAMIEKKWFYHIEEPSGEVTVCLVRDINGMYHRGISICIYPNRFQKSRGRDISFGRAKKAMALKGDPDSIYREDVESFINSYSNLWDIVDSNKSDEAVGHKSLYNVRLTESEKRLSRKKFTVGSDTRTWL